MGRLQAGENPKIDMINALVADIKSYSSTSKESMTALLDLFHPMLLNICSRWSRHFADDTHTLIRFDELLSDAQYWFMKYTMETYTINGSAAYNKFIKDHMTQRIRYIYECKIKYYKNNIFPDPNKQTDNDNDDDMLENVTYKYKSDHGITIEDEYEDNYTQYSRNELANQILTIVSDTNNFNDRDSLIFISIVYKGKTHDEIAKQLDISRTRVTQILKRVKGRLYKLLENNQDIWTLINCTDITFNEQE